MTPDDVSHKGRIVIENEPFWLNDKHTKYANDYNLDTLKKGFCRNCSKKIKPYPRVYFEYEYYVVPVFYKYCADNGYCEECAIKHAETKHKSVNIEVIERTHDTREKVTYSDGSVLESWVPGDPQYKGLSDPILKEKK